MRVALSMIALLVAGCATSHKDPMQWMRSDARSIHASPELAQQFQVDTMLCNSEMHRAKMSGTVAVTGNDWTDAFDESGRDKEAVEFLKGCMGQRGYVLLRESEARARMEAAARAPAQPAAVSGAAPARPQ